MAKKPCFEFTETNTAPVRLIQTSKHRFTVQYGQQQRADLNHHQAALELGSCIMHALACDHRLDNGGKD